MKFRNSLITAAIAGVALAANADHHQKGGSKGPGHKHDHAAAMKTGKGKKTGSGSEIVQCYGVSKAGQNACTSAHEKGAHGCAGYAVCDYDGREWVKLARDKCLKKGGKETPFDNPKMTGPADKGCTPKS